METYLGTRERKIETLDMESIITEASFNAIQEAQMSIVAKLVLFLNVEDCKAAPPFQVVKENIQLMELSEALWLA